ncbi:hypothetical protein D1007_45057 [Hordeum vulgare]|nr:hypothetical protein D1007_45057 [Hordeum vulgare]
MTKYNSPWPKPSDRLGCACQLEDETANSLVGQATPAGYRMVDDDGPWYDGLIEDVDREHRARAIENRKRNPPPVNHAALTTLTDYWRPETHSFHLACEEMTMTLEDMAMISGLPINDLAVTSHVSAVNLRAWVGDLIGVQPPLPLPRTADSSKVKHFWLKKVTRAKNLCPADADEMVVQQYARAYLWYVLTKVVFTDATRNSALWMYLELLRDCDTQCSWGSAALAYLYRQLDHPSTRTNDTSSLCGFVWSLSMWMWERLPVGRPVFKNPDKPNPNPHEGLHDQDPYRRPTIAYCWDQVSWRPYENDRDFNSNEMYKVFQLRRARTITRLHRFSRRNNQDISYCANKHNQWITMWNQRETLVELENRPHNDSTYHKYLVWYGQRYRLKLMPDWTQEEWSELVSEDPSAAQGYHAFNMAVRGTVGSQVDYAPMHEELVIELT